MITEYKEDDPVPVTPEDMQERGVFTREDLTTQWDNASDQFSWGSYEYLDDLPGALEEIKDQIDKYDDPVVLRIASTTAKHFVTVYGYKNSCKTAADVLIKDPLYRTNTLQEAFKYWKNFRYLKRII